VWLWTVGVTCKFAEWTRNRGMGTTTRQPFQVKVMTRMLERGKGPNCLLQGEAFVLFIGYLNAYFHISNVSAGVFHDG